MNAKGIIVKWIVLWCCLVGQPGGAQGAQGVPSGAGSLDARFFAAIGVDPAWDGSPTVRLIVPQPDGRVWIGGGFDQVQRFPRRGLARLQATGSLDRGSNVPVPGPQRGTLVFAPGESRKTITLPIHDNLLLDGNHSFHQLG